MENEVNKGFLERKEGSINQDQIHDLIFSRDIGWQEIIYDLINTEQIDPWNVDIILLTDKYLEKIKSLEEADFFISGRVLLAASILLRLKSEFLLNKYLKSVDEILFGKKETKERKELEKVEIGNLPEIIPRTPLPRFRRVTLQELMEALNKAIITENRRIKKEIFKKNPLIEESLFIQKRRINIKDKIRSIYTKILEQLRGTNKKRISFSELVKGEGEEKIFSFIPLLYLEHQEKVWLEQDTPFSDFYIWLNHVYFEYNKQESNELEDNIFKNQLIDGGNLTNP